MTARPRQDCPGIEDSRLRVAQHLPGAILCSVSSLRFLLLQARRPGDPAGPHEVEAFAEILEIAPEALTPWDLLSSAPTPDDAAAYDAVLVGGSGEFGVGDTASEPWAKFTVWVAL